MTTKSMADKSGAQPNSTAATKVSGTFTKGLENVFVSGKFSDLTITCKDRTWNAHKVVVCTQSEFFMKACEDGFKESKENVIDLPKDDPGVIDTLLYYFYHFDYEDGEVQSAHVSSLSQNKEEEEASTDARDDAQEAGDKLDPHILHIRLFQVADKYLIEPLKSLTVEKFNIHATSEWNTSSFTNALLEVYDPTFLAADADLLRLIVLENVKFHAKDLFHASEHDAFRTAVLQAPDFLLAYSKDLTGDMSGKATLPRVSDISWYRCPGFMCRRHGAVFGFKASVPERFHMNCPLRCETDRDMEWWRKHKTVV